MTLTESSQQSSSPAFSYKKYTTCDSDQHAESLVAWNQTYDQLSVGSFAGSLVDIWFDGMQLFREITNRSLSQSGTSWKDSYVFGIPLAASGMGLFSKQLLPLNALFCFRGSEGFSLRTPEFYDLVGVSLPASALDELFNINDKRAVEFFLSGNPLVLTPPLEKLDALRRCLASMFEFGPVQFHYPQIQRAMRSAIMGHLSEVLQTASPARPPAPSFKGRCHVVEQSIKYAMAHRDQSVTVSDLCEHASISRRMLNYCFQDVLDTNPVQYLRALRLNGARRELRSDYRAKEGIHDVAYRWGFWHLSRFAEEYRTLFGELPSETIKSRGRTLGA